MYGDAGTSEVITSKVYGVVSLMDFLRPVRAGLFGVVEMMVGMEGD